MPQGPRPFRPETLGEARQLIQKTFDRQRWDERSQRFYLNNLGLQPRPVAELDLDACRLVLARMERSRMIIFAEKIAGTYCRPCKQFMPDGSTADYCGKCGGRLTEFSKAA